MKLCKYIALLNDLSYFWGKRKFVLQQNVSSLVKYLREINVNVNDECSFEASTVWHFLWSNGGYRILHSDSVLTILLKYKNYLHFLHTNTVFLVTLFGTLSQPRWYQPLQLLHSTINLPSSGILQWQYNWTVVENCTLLLLLVPQTGNSVNIPPVKQETKWFLMASWSHFINSGELPWQRDTAAAIANSPQSVSPSCCCISTHSAVNECPEPTTYASCFNSLFLSLSLYGR